MVDNGADASLQLSAMQEKRLTRFSNVQCVANVAPRWMHMAITPKSAVSVRVSSYAMIPSSSCWAMRCVSWAAYLAWNAACSVYFAARGRSPRQVAWTSTQLAKRA
jgi:hypothetical protein